MACLVRSVGMKRLKVYQAEIDGLHQWIVAAPNKRAALDAFGVHQDLFAQGMAKVSDDAAAIKAAAAKPGEPLRRLTGSSDPFKPVEPGGVTAWTKAAEALPKTAKAKPPSRKTLDRAEAALAKFEAEAQSELDAFESQRAVIAAKEAKARARHDRKRADFAEAVDAAREAYRAAGARA